MLLIKLVCYFSNILASQHQTLSAATSVIWVEYFSINWVNSASNPFSSSTSSSQCLRLIASIFSPCNFISRSLAATNSSISLSWTVMNLAISSALQLYNEMCKKIMRTSIPKLIKWDTGNLSMNLKYKVAIRQNFFFFKKYLPIGKNKKMQFCFRYQISW